MDPIRLGPDDGDRILEFVELHGHLLKPSKVSVGLPEDMRNYESLLNAMILFFTSIILDLHCDDEGVPYLYVPAALWPGMADCAAALGVEAVLTWQGRSDGEFEEASIHPYLASGADLTARVVTTVELRGIADVERGFAQADADGLYRLLVARGVVADKAAKPAAGVQRRGGAARQCRNGEDAEGRRSAL